MTIFDLPCTLDPTLKQLDVVYTDCPSLFQEPSILPPMQVDEGKVGKDAGVMVLTRNNLAREGGEVREKIRVRPFPESGIINFGLRLIEEEWGAMEEEDMSSSDMVDSFVRLNNNMVDSVFPEKEIRVGPGDLPYFSEELRHLKRQRLRAYNNHGGRHGKRTKQAERCSGNFFRLG